MLVHHWLIATGAGTANWKWAAGQNLKMAWTGIPWGPQRPFLPIPYLSQVTT